MSHPWLAVSFQLRHEVSGILSIQSHFNVGYPVSTSWGLVSSKWGFESQNAWLLTGVAPKLLRRWCKIYSEHGEAGLQPKKKGRPLGAKQKPEQELTPMEKLELRIKQLEAENAILKKVAALKDWRN